MLENTFLHIFLEREKAVTSFFFDSVLPTHWVLNRAEKCLKIVSAPRYRDGRFTPAGRLAPCVTPTACFEYMSYLSIKLLGLPSLKVMYFLQLFPIRLEFRTVIVHIRRIGNALWRNPRGLPLKLTTPWPNHDELRLPADVFGLFPYYRALRHVVEIDCN